MRRVTSSPMKATESGVRVARLHGCKSNPCRVGGFPERSTALSAFHQNRNAGKVKGISKNLFVYLREIS